MSLVLRALFWVAVAGTVTSSIYCLMVVVAAVRFGLRKRREDRAGMDFLPPVSVFKPMHGIEPGMEQNLTTFFEQDYPEFELLFCARHETDEGLKVARAVAARYPEVNARFVTCGEPTPEFHNAKVFSLAKLDSVAKYDVVVSSDADVRVVKDYLRRLVQNLKQPEMGLASCLYIGTVEEEQGKASLAAHLDAVGKSVEMSSGVMVADMLEGTKFALGPTMVLRRRSFEDAGGFEDIGRYYAEDFVIGNRLANKGIGVKMATHVIRLMVQDQPFWLSFKDQLRWMRSTRKSRPWGHFGTGATFAMPFGLMGLVWGLASGHAGLGAVWLLGMVVNRWLQAGTVLNVLGDPDWLRGTVIYPLRDLLGSLLWVGSYVSKRFYYRGGIYVLNEGGTVDAVK
jgi:ceramide glucosyltransferase